MMKAAIALTFWLSGVIGVLLGAYYLYGWRGAVSAWLCLCIGKGYADTYATFMEKNDAH